MTIPGFKRLYKVFSLFICLNPALWATSHEQELKNCKAALLYQINEQKKVHTSNCPISTKLVYWLGILRNPSQFTAKELITFLDKHPHWPHHEKLCRKAEEVIVKDASASELLQWFNKYPPQTPPGIIAYGKALLESQQRTKAKLIVATAWHTLEFTKDEEKQFLRAFSSLLEGKDHLERLEFFLWNENTQEARSVFPHVSISIQNLAQARMALIEGKSYTTPLTAEQKKNEGFLFARAKWHKKKKEYEAAAGILLTAPLSPKRAPYWWNLQNYIARELIEEKNYSKAYQIVNRHKLEPGTEDFANAQWLLGWLALQFLKKPDTAKTHFERLYANVEGALSKARSAYWMGRVYEKKGEYQSAETWFKRAAQYKTTYYGQLAAAKIRHKPHPTLAMTSSVTHDLKKKFHQNELVKAAHILKELGSAANHELTKFIFHIADTAKTKAEREFAVDLAHDLSTYDVVWAARKAGYRDPITLKKAYPICAIPRKGQAIPEKSLVMAIAYQESRFNPTVQSAAGAIGLMQLMPKTAAQEAKRLRVSHHEKKLYDPTHNLHIGSAHLSSLLNKFDSSYILTIAAYNAGEEPVQRWLQTFGDPRTGEVDIVDWVELIPYSETRNYVMRVLENITVYRCCLENQPKATLLDDLKR